MSKDNSIIECSKGPVYVVGPCGSGKTSIAKFFNVHEVDEIAKLNNPGLYALKPWRYWMGMSQEKGLAEQWNQMQQLALEELSAANGRPLVISHPAALCSAAQTGNIRKGIVVVLQPHKAEAWKQRKDRESRLLLSVNWSSWDVQGNGRAIEEDLGSKGFIVIGMKESIPTTYLFQLLDTLLGPHCDLAVTLLIGHVMKENPRKLDIVPKRPFY